MARPITTAAILAVGTELTTGVTRDTNSGDLARELTALGVRVLSSTALPDDLETVRDAFRAGIDRADLIVSTGGLGPTPDDLTREAIAAACGLEPYIDPDLLAWLEALFGRRGATMPEANRKQAWLIEGAESLPNNHGSAPGWWVERPDERLVIALPGPPREWKPMWHEHALPRLQSGRLGVDRVSRTLRLTGIGESALVGLIGEDVLRAANPQVATYARSDAVDVVVTTEADGRSTAQELAGAAVRLLRERVGEYVFAEGDATWAEALAVRLGGRTLAIAEVGTGGQVGALLGAAEFTVHAELFREGADLTGLASSARAAHGADVALAVGVRQTHDSYVRIAIATAHGVTKLERVAFLAGDEGMRRAAIAACAALWSMLGENDG